MNRSNKYITTDISAISTYVHVLTKFQQPKTFLNVVFKNRSSYWYIDAINVTVISQSNLFHFVLRTIKAYSIHETVFQRTELCQVSNHKYKEVAVWAYSQGHLFTSVNTGNLWNMFFQFLHRDYFLKLSIHHQNT